MVPPDWLSVPTVSVLMRFMSMVSPLMLSVLAVPPTIGSTVAAPPPLPLKTAVDVLVGRALVQLKGRSQSPLPVQVVVCAAAGDVKPRAAKATAKARATSRARPPCDDVLLPNTTLPRFRRTRETPAR